MLLTDLKLILRHRNWPAVEKRQTVIFDMRDDIVKRCHQKNEPMETSNSETTVWGNSKQRPQLKMQTEV